MRVPSHGGGRLKVGGHNPGAGRPPSVVRRTALGFFDAALPKLGAVAQGLATERSTVKLAEVLKVIECAKCGPKTRFRVKGNRKANEVELEAMTTARVADQVRAATALGNLGLGPDKQLTVESVRERLQRMIAVLREELPAELFKRVEPRLRHVWTANE